MAKPRGIKSGNKNIRLDWDQQEFEKKAEQFLKEVPEALQEILVETAPEFSKAAAKYTPPSMGKGSIQKKYFERPVLVLARLINGRICKANSHRSR